MNLTKELFDFLNSDYKTFHIREDNKYYDIAKIQHNSFIDLLFINSNNYHKTTIGDKFEYCGFYDNEKKQLYDINYTLRKDILKLDWDDKTYKSVNDLLKEINTKVCDTVNTYVEEFKEEFYKTTHSKFRQPTDVQRIIVSLTDNMKNRTNIFDKSDYRHFPPTCNKAFSLISRDFLTLDEEMPCLFCLNDFEGKTDREILITLKILEYLFPEKSSFEK